MDPPAKPEDKNKILAGFSYFVLLLGAPFFFLHVILWTAGGLIDIGIYILTKNKYARYHASQAIWTIFLFVILDNIFTFISLKLDFGEVHFQLYAYTMTGILLLATILAFQGRDFRIPFAYRLSEK